MIKTSETPNPPEESQLTRRKRSFAKASRFPVAIQLGKVNSRNIADTKNADSVDHSPIFECFTAGNIDNLA